MKRMALVLLLVALATPAAFAQSFVATLSGANEVPPADPDGTGRANITISGTTVTYSITVSNIDAPTAQHIHSGVAGVNGPIVVTLTGTWMGTPGATQTLQGSVATDAATAQAIDANPAAFYVNVHNAAFPGGAVRGQLAHFNAIPTASTLGLFALAAILALGGFVIVRRL